MTTEAMDALCAEVVGAFADAGVDAIVLKGPAIARWLYPDGGRTYHDIDVLVDPTKMHETYDVLFALGFSPPAPAYTEDVPGHAQAWHRYDDGGWLDLHYTLTGIDPLLLWDRVWPRRTVMDVGGRAVPVLDEGARALHVALHVAQDNLGQTKKLEDLRRAIEHLPAATWDDAASLARDLDAAAAMGAGLRQVTAGAAIADRLRLPAPDRLDLLVRASDAAPGTDAFEFLMRRPGLTGKARYAMAKAFPPPWFLRSWTPLARRWGPVGLVLGYGQRLVWVARTTPPAVRGWLDARRRLRSSRG